MLVISVRSSLTHPADCGRRRELEVVRLEDKVDVVSEADSLPVGQREEVVVVKHRVERLDPLGIHVSVANQPRLDLKMRIGDWCTSSVCEPQPRLREHLMGGSTPYLAQVP